MTAPDTKWKLRRSVDGAVLTELELETLVEWAKAGTVTPEDRIMPPGMSVWLPPGQIAQLKTALEPKPEQKRAPPTGQAPRSEPSPARTPTVKLAAPPSQPPPRPAPMPSRIFLPDEAIPPLPPRTAGDDEDVQADITSMIDVTMLLLIFFMVTASIAAQKSVEVPETVSGAGLPLEEKILVGVDEEAEAGLRYYFGDSVSEPLNREQMLERVTAAVPLAADKSVILRAGLDVQHGEVVKLMQELKQCGATGVHIGVQEKK